MDKLYERITGNPTLQPLGFKDSEFYCLTNGYSKDVPHHEFSFFPMREMVIVLTLEEMPVYSRFFDWVSLRCGRRNVFRGLSDVIFPMRKLSLIHI